jgi:hypothetical protein
MRHGGAIEMIAPPPHFLVDLPEGTLDMKPSLLPELT